MKTKITNLIIGTLVLTLFFSCDNQNKERKTSDIVVK